MDLQGPVLDPPDPPMDPQGPPQMVILDPQMVVFGRFCDRFPSGGTLRGVPMATMVVLEVVVAIATCVRGRFGGRGRGFVWLDGGPRRSVVVVHVDLCGWMVVHDVPWW